MNDELSSLISLTQEIFDIIKNDYGKYLKKEKQELLDNNNLFKIIDDTIYYQKDGFSYPLKKDNLGIEIIIFMCLASLCGNLTPLKIALIDYEVNQIIENNTLERTLEVNNFELVDILKSRILDELPYNIIFFDTDIEIFDYLANEKDVKVAKLYYEINSSLGNFTNPLDYYLTYKNFNYEEAYDKVYNFINKKII